MADKPTHLVQGTPGKIILKTLALKPMHGYGIAVRLEQMNKGAFRLNAVRCLSPFSGCNERG
jgi:PadR family transcriptional regulator PadR